MAQTNPSTLAQSLWPASTGSFARSAAFAVGGALLLTLSAKFEVPFYPVPMTMQPLVVIGLGLALGGRLALAAVLLYLAQGAASLPVFAGTPEKGLGLAYMMGPTGGFLIGMALAAWTTGTLADRGWSRSYLASMAAGLVGLALIYAPGVAYLSGLIGYEKAVTFGFWPFIAKDLVGTAIAALGVPALWQLFRR